jgi:sugar phosphate isomerase/epimerase
LDSVKGLKFNFDNGNFFNSGDDMLDAYDEFWEDTVNVHIKEWQYTEDENKGMLCADGKFISGGLHGKGLLDQEGMINALKKKGYDGYISIEYEGELDRREGIKLALSYIKSIM